MSEINFSNVARSGANFSTKHGSTGPKEKTTFCKSFLKIMFSHVGLFLIVCLYAVSGAYALIWIESDAEEMRFNMKKISAENLANSVDYITKYSWYHNSQKHELATFAKGMKKILKLFHNLVVDSAINDKYDGNPNQWNYDWTFAKSILFTVTTMGAIGYGHIVPKTSNGQLFCMYYGMFGVPLLLLFLANIGEFLATSFRYIYSRLCCRLCRIRRRVTQLKGKQTLEPKVLWKEEIGTERFMPTSQVDVPIVVNLCVIFVYLMMGGALFSFWENWNLSEATYFTFITLTTIGFGDYVPGNSFAGGGDQSFVSMMKMFVTIAFCLFGMALLSMAINLMQEQLIAKAKWLASEMGRKDPDAIKKKYQVKKSEEGSVQVTPQDRDGNRHLTLHMNNVSVD